MYETDLARDHSAHSPVYTQFTLSSPEEVYIYVTQSNIPIQHYHIVYIAYTMYSKIIFKHHNTQYNTIYYTAPFTVAGCI